jgi:hypothetical protein
MRCLYQKDERALPGNLQNSPQNVVSLTTSHFFLLSLSLSLSLSWKGAAVQSVLERGG